MVLSAKKTPLFLTGALLLLSLALSSIARAAEGDETQNHSLLREQNQIRLLFGLEEELRSANIRRMAIGSTVAYFSALYFKPELIWLFSLVPATNIYSLDLLRSSAEQSFFERMLAYCKTHPTLTCEPSEEDKFTLIFKRRSDGKTITLINVWHDPFVSEFTASPFTSARLETEFGEIIDTALYRIAKSAGLRPAMVGAEGHLHVDFDSLFFDPIKQNYDYLFFRNYVVDWVNHDELYYGALHYDPKLLGAIPLLETEALMANFRDWLKRYDRMLDAGKMTPLALKTFRQELANDCKFSKGQALNILPHSTVYAGPNDSYVPGTIEIRSLRPKRDFAELKRTIQIIEGRARYLKSVREKLKFQDAGTIQSVSEGVNRFFRFVNEAQLDWDEMRKLLPKTWQKKTPNTALTEQELFRPGPRKPPVGQRFCQRVLSHLLGD